MFIKKVFRMFGNVRRHFFQSRGECHRGELCDYFAYRINDLFSFSATVSSVDIYLNRTKRGKKWFNLSCIVF